MQFSSSFWSETAGQRRDRPGVVAHANSRVMASALTSSRGWFKWLKTMVPGSMPKPW